MVREVLVKVYVVFRSLPDEYDIMAIYDDREQAEYDVKRREANNAVWAKHLLYAGPMPAFGVEEHELLDRVSEAVAAR